MRSLSLSITIIPAIAILLDTVLYVFLLRHINQKKMFRQIVVTTILFAFFSTWTGKYYKCLYSKEAFTIGSISCFAYWLR
jgi:hypothetical protein